MRGIPTVILTRNDFTGVTINAIAGFGFAPEAPMVTFPIDLFLVESDLSPLKRNVDEFIHGLTRWAPSITSQGLITPPGMTVEGTDYEEAYSTMNTRFLKNLWGDGLPLTPPTEKRVQWILTGTDRPPDARVGRIMPKGGVATIHTLAVTLAMAGGRPEHLPVLIAAVEAIIDPALNHQQFQATSCSVYPVVIVNGPVAEQIRINSGFGLLGPDPSHPAGGIIGRAIRLLLQNVGGAVPGKGTMSMFGGMRYTNAVFAEDERNLPPGWEPFCVEYGGFPKGTNTVSVSPASSAVNIVRRGMGKETLAEEAETSLHLIASFMKSFNVNGLVLDRGVTELQPKGIKGRPPGILILSSVVARQLAELGWARDGIREFLWENTKIPLSELKRTGIIRWVEFRNTPGHTIPDPWPITDKPENIIIVVAGGRHPTHAYWLQSAFASKVINRQIKLPAGWDALIQAAENELGPLPDGPDNNLIL